MRCRAPIASVVLAIGTGGSVVAAPDEATSIEGVVVDCDGEPIAGAYVEPTLVKWTPETKPVNGALTAADDAFRFEHLFPTDVYRFRVGAARFAWTLTGEASAGRRDVRVVLAAERTLAGHVVDAEKRPVAGVEVKTRLEAAACPPRATTDGDGAFVLDRLGREAGELIAVARDRGAAKLAKWVTRRAGVRAADGPVDVVVGAGQTIDGRVVDELGAPKAGVGVQAWPASWSPDGRRELWPSARTDAAGAIRIEGLPQGRRRLALWYGDGGVGSTGPGRKLRGGEDVAAGATDVVLTYGYVK